MKFETARIHFLVDVFDAVAVVVAIVVIVMMMMTTVYEFAQISRQQSEKTSYLVFIDVKYQVGKLCKQSYCRILGISCEQ